MEEEKLDNTSRNYNKVYESLVKNQNDIVGFIAYGLYKKSKQDFITAFKKEHKKDPSVEDISTHVACSETPKLEAVYRKEAERILKVLLELAVTEKELELEKNFQTKLWRYIKDHEPPNFLEKIYTFIKSSFSGVIGNVITTALAILFLYFASSQSSKDALTSGARENIVSGIAEALGVETVKIKP